MQVRATRYDLLKVELLRIIYFQQFVSCAFHLGILQILKIVSENP